MKLLVTAARWLFHVDTETHEVTPVRVREHGGYGLSWTYDGMTLCTVHDRTDRANWHKMEDYADSEIGSVALGEATRINCLSAPHQALCTPEHIVVANSGRNCITVFRQDDLSYFHHWFDGNRWDRKGDDNPCGSHFNSVCLQGDRLYVLAHNFSSVPERMPYIVELQWPSLEEIRRIDAPSIQPHNVWPQPQGRFIICDSLSNTLCRIPDGKVLCRAPSDKWMTRGLACHGNRVFVGLSMFSRSRETRQVGDGAVWVLDRKTWRTEDLIRLPRAGQVCEVRIVDAEDECHHGNPFIGQLPFESEAQNIHAKWVGPRRCTSSDGLAISGENWQIVEGVFSSTDDGVIFPEGGVTGIALKKGYQAKDLRISAGVIVPKQEKERYAGLVGRYIGPGEKNMYVAQVYRNGTCQLVHLWRNVAGKWTLLGMSTIPKDVKGRLAFLLKGESLTVAMGKTPLLQVTDDALPEKGQFGVRANSGRIAGIECQELC